MKYLFLFINLVSITTYSQTILGGAKKSDGKTILKSNYCDYTIFDGVVKCNPGNVLVSNTAYCPESATYYCSNTNSCNRSCEAANDAFYGSVVKGNSLNRQLFNNNSSKINNDETIDLPTKNEKDNNQNFSSTTECLTTSCWFFSRQTTSGYLPPDGKFTFNLDGSFTFNNYLTGNTHGGYWKFVNSSDILLKYTSSTANKLNSDMILSLLNCNTLQNGQTTFLRMDGVTFINSKKILHPDGTKWEIYCRGELLN